MKRYLVRTDFGDVVVGVNPDASGFDADLIEVTTVEPDELDSFDMTTPLRAFGAKMVDIIELQGTAEFSGSEAMREMMVREKATAELKRIERFAKETLGD